MQSKQEKAVAVVTGARQGIGKGIALALGQSGFNIVMADVLLDDVAQQTMGEISALGVQCKFIQADIADVESRFDTTGKMFAAFGRVDTLVNNAGVQVKVRGDLLDVTPESYDRVMGINLRGSFFLTQAVAKRMIALSIAPTEQHRSTVTISSANAYLVGPDRPEYCF